MNSEKKYRLSKWTHVFQRENTIALYHALTLGLVYLPDFEGDVSDLANPCAVLDHWHALLEPETVQALLDEGLLVLETTDDKIELTQLAGRLQKDIALRMLYLLVTDDCNLCCRYCFEEAPRKTGVFRPKYMIPEVAHRALDVFAALSARYGNTKQKKIIHLYGGEPLLNRQAVEASVKYATGLIESGFLQADTVLTVVTNGTLLDATYANLFAENHVTVGLSLDGPREVTNLYRMAKRDRHTDVYTRVMAAYELLKGKGVSIGISVTLTPAAIEQFDQLLEFFTRELKDADGFSLNLMHYNRGVVPSDDYYRKAVECQIQAFEFFRQRGIFEERVMRKAKAFIDRKPMYDDCGVTGGQIVVAPDGQIGVCQDFVKPRTYFSGSVNNPHADPFAEGLFEGWSNRSPFYMAECMDCSAIGICGGGCPASAELKYGSRSHIDERICYHSKRILEWLVWDTFANLI